MQLHQHTHTHTRAMNNCNLQLKLQRIFCLGLCSEVRDWVEMLENRKLVRIQQTGNSHCCRDFVFRSYVSSVNFAPPDLDMC